MLSFQGYLMLIPGFSTTPRPSLAPKRRRRALFRPEPGFSGLMKKNTFTKYQVTCFSLEAPICFLYQSLLYVSLATCGFMRKVACIFQVHCYCPYIQQQNQTHLPTIHCIETDPS